MQLEGTVDASQCMCLQHRPVTAQGPGACCKGPCSPSQPPLGPTASIGRSPLSVTSTCPIRHKLRCPRPTWNSECSLSSITHRTQEEGNGPHFAAGPFLLPCRWPASHDQQCCSQFAPEMHRFGPSCRLKRNPTERRDSMTDSPSSRRKTKRSKSLVFLTATLNLAQCESLGSSRVLGPRTRPASACNQDPMGQPAIYYPVCPIRFSCPGNLNVQNRKVSLDKGAVTSGRYCPAHHHNSLAW
jgi:hypothetical protein